MVLRSGVLLLLVLDLDEQSPPDSLAECRDELFLVASRLRLRRLSELELAEGLLELAPYPLERRVRVRGDHRADVFERQPDRPSLERRQARRRTERIAVHLLVDANLVAL